MAKLEYWESMGPGQHKALSVVSKVAGFSSFVMSLLVAISIVRRKKRQSYHRLFLGVALTDMISSPVYMISTWAIPKSEILANRYPNQAAELVNLQWNIGTHLTCQTQAFLAQFSCSTCFYTVSLLIYFYLVVLHRWRESKILQLERYLHVFPIALGLLSATAGLSLGIYGVVPPVCYIAERKQIYWILFMYIPGWGLFLLTVLINVLIYRHVRSQENRSNRFSFPQQATAFQAEEMTSAESPQSSTYSSRTLRRSSIGGLVASSATNTSPSATNEVAQQCLFFGLASGFHFLGLFIQTFQWAITGGITFHSSIVTFSTLPLFGLPSGCVYFRPKFNALRKRHPNQNLLQIAMETVAGWRQLGEDTPVTVNEKEGVCEDVAVIDETGVVCEGSR